MKTNGLKELAKIARKHIQIEVCYYKYCKSYTVGVWHDKKARSHTTGEGKTLLQAIKDFNKKDKE